MYDELIAYCNQNKKVYCFGAGVYGRIIRAYLDDLGISIEGFVVSSMQANEKKVLDLPVISLDEMIQFYKNEVGVIICAGLVFRCEMKEHLKKNNISNIFEISDEVINEIRRKWNFKHQYTITNNITVFCYHRVTNIPLDTWKLAVSPELFEEQIRYIKTHYKVIRSEEDFKADGEGRLAVITFDDGYSDSYTEALPILEKYQIPATVFVCMGNIDSEREFWWDYLEKLFFMSDIKDTMFEFGEKKLFLTSEKQRINACYYVHSELKKMTSIQRSRAFSDLENIFHVTTNRDYCRSLSKVQLRELSKSPLITIGGHTINHPSLARENMDTQEYEIRESKTQIEDIIGKSISVFSYPFGQKTDFDDTTIEIAHKCGYQRVYAAFSGYTKREYIDGYIPRINIGQEKNMKQTVRRLRLCDILYGD
ncbi:Polysaccharide deacetylase [Oribacterium sp. KHPX15]|uniref:polysaccharide deacetylase family protein n=1 Tax=Oribacterium sp. KHPX15 TaxID=1855342 RepID=UPI00089AE9E0|nr:polysaccharide deacetylase family protein [Oribacterium sp. KHPX15]SEA83545.1 Polysaccharide deacetylase [Oribacterium sp. KHPX15]